MLEDQWNEVRFEGKLLNKNKCAPNKRLKGSCTSSIVNISSDMEFAN